MFALVNGIVLYYTTVGQGPPILLLHGNGEDHTIFDKLSAALSATHRVYMIDSRGHGKSTQVKELHYVDMAEDVAGLIKALALEKPALYGFSDGGIVGLLVAIRHPDLLGKLAVSGANFTPTGVKPLIGDSFRLLYRLNHSSKLALMMNEPNISPAELASIRVPTLVMAGSRDLIRPAHTRRLAAAIPGAQLLILPGETHGSYVVHSTKVYAAMKKFLEA